MIFKVPDFLISPTYGHLPFEKMVEILKKNIISNSDCDHEIIVGSDSQSHGSQKNGVTKYVLVVALHNVGHGGIFFYYTWKDTIAHNIRQKLTTETRMSLLCANKLLDAFDSLSVQDNFDYTQIHFSIHVDAGYDGKSKELIPELVGWIHNEGWDCETKPDSFVASTIADRISK